MPANVIASVPIETETFPGLQLVFFFLTDNLDQAVKATEEGRRMAAQIQQNFIVHQIIRSMINDQGRFRRSGIRGSAMGEEGGLL